MAEHRGFLGWVSSIFRPFPPIRRVASGGFTQPKVLLIGDEKVGKSAFLRLIGMKQHQPLKTWEPRSTKNSVTIAHKEDRTATYIEEEELVKPFPIFSLTTTDVVVFCFSLVDRLTWGSVLTGLDAVHKEDVKTKNYHPVIIVGLKADLRDDHIKKLKQQEQQEQQQRARHSGSGAQAKDDSSDAKYWTPSEHPQWNASSLPMDVLLRLFSYLPTRDLVSATLVCSQWAQVAKHPYNWSNRARGFLTAKQARDHLRSDALRNWPILYFEINAGKDQKDSRPVQQAIYQIVVAVASNTRTLPPAVVKQLEEDASLASTSSSTSSSSSSSSSSGIIAGPTSASTASSPQSSSPPPSSSPSETNGQQS